MDDPSCLVWLLITAGVMALYAIASGGPLIEDCPEHNEDQLEGR